MSLDPDISGFAAAQTELRDQFGEDIVFLQETEVTFPPGTPVDPETGKPYDPAIEPTASGQASAVVKCNVAFRSANESVEFGALGITEATRIMLICDLDDRDVIEPANEFICREERYAISAQRPDGLGPTLQRWLVYGRRK